MRQQAHGFSLVELLVVTAIISILAALLLPALHRAIVVAQGVACMGQQRQVYFPYHEYTSDFSGYVVNRTNGHYANWFYANRPDGIHVPNNLANFFADAYLTPDCADLVMCPAHAYTEVDQNGTGQLERVRTLAASYADTGQSACGGLSTYLLRGTDPAKYWAESDSCNRALAWPTYNLKHSGSQRCLASKLQNLVTGGLWRDRDGNILTRTTFSFAVLMCGLPTHYWDYNPTVHSREAFNVLFADGTCHTNACGPESGYMRPDYEFGSWDLKFRGADTVHPGYRAPWNGYSNPY